MSEPKQAKLEGHSSISQHDKAVLNRLFNPNLPYGDLVDEDAAELGETADAEETEAHKHAKAIEIHGVTAAESGDIQAALDLFNEAISVAPDWASAYNNRAQALRLKGDVHGANEDLDKAIELSAGHGRAACQAHTQRGIIRRLEGDDEHALEDFKIAAKLGNEFAKHQVMLMNPYAALCNQMLAEVMHKIQRGEM
ncbi:tetratricopeptide repeat protein 36-like [Gigantopelta aegis]|uniref:tetratricopeptide repeat protein 36-like n=1 Tax=Gigantopelta aegis TaxID=1735272 RepID=UPI001B888559|nr:tetratricopeptide repeat protein 36-like [Gigantopelta aegis]